MPYGMKGGDTPKKDAKMERCVSDLTAKGYKKLNAILICKASIQKASAKGRR